VPALILQLTRVGFLILLWLFVLAAIRVIRADLRLAANPRVSVSGQSRREARRAAKAPTAGKQRPGLLVVTAGSMAGTRIRIGDAPVLIGRAEDSTLVLDDDYASTRHARLSRTEDTVYVEDLGSTNGTYLDRNRVVAPTPVPMGTPIRIGRTVIELRP
jgi:pSer/pThr/pTyr-binding forkhead associated (FHA) protein